MDTGTAIGISLGSVAATVLLLGFFGFITKLPVAYPAGPVTQTIFEKFTIINWFKVLYYFLPYGLFLFGIIYDGLIKNINFFPAGFIGLAAVYINSWVSYFMNNKIATIDTDICGIPGMSEWGSNIAPQNIVFVSAVLSYIATHLTVKPINDNPMSYGSVWIGVVAIWLVQAVIFNKSGCLGIGNWVGGTGITGSILVPFLGLIVGGGLGALSGGLIAQFVGSGSGASSGQTQSLTGGKGPAIAPTSGTAGAGKCSSTGGDDDQFVCEAYKNGELVTSTIVE